MTEGSYITLSPFTASKINDLVGRIQVHGVELARPNPSFPDIVDYPQATIGQSATLDLSIGYVGPCLGLYLQAQDFEIGIGLEGAQMTINSAFVVDKGETSPLSPTMAGDFAVRLLGIYLKAELNG